MSFKEFTFIEPESYLEIMVDVNAKTGKIINAYTYVNDVRNIIDEDRDDVVEELKKIKLKKLVNPLFGHNKRLAKLSGLVVSPENEDEWNFLHEVRKVNDLFFEILEP